MGVAIGRRLRDALIGRPPDEDIFSPGPSKINSARFDSHPGPTIATLSNVAEVAIYRGWCRTCATEHGLERTEDAIRAARGLMARLRDDPRFGHEGKMMGVLVGRAADGTRRELHAFSGMIDGNPSAHGFVGPTRAGILTADAEKATLAQLTALSHEIEAIDVAGAERALVEARAAFDARLSSLGRARLRARRARAERRAALEAESRDAPEELAEMIAASQREGGRIRALRRERREAIEPLAATLEHRRETRRRLRAKRRDISRTLQLDMHASHGLLSFSGRHARLEEFFVDGTRIPAGTGECCAPKLLQEAALLGIRPTGAAEFWWGPPPPAGGREHGAFYPPCEEKCDPILGHLLCGLERPAAPVTVLYEDDDLLAIDKPAGLLSVPGRGTRGADCVETRLALLRPEDPFLRAVHRLDQATSGVLLLARSESAHRALSGAFAGGLVHKEYRARVAGHVARDRGTIRLPLRPDVEDRPRQVVDPARGRPAVTQYRVVERCHDRTELALWPRTGRTHQLRVHCAHDGGLGAPILGDTLYGSAEDAARLFLHATDLAIPHPRTGHRLDLQAPLPNDWTAV